MAKFCKHCGSEIDTKTGLCPKCNLQKLPTSKSKKKSLALIITIIVLLIVAAITIIALSYFNVVNIPFLSSLFNQKNDKEDVYYDNGDITYHSSIEQVSFDEKNNVVFFNDVLVVYTFSDLPEEKVIALAKSVDGEVVGDISGIINVLQIKVAESTLEELNKKSDILMNSDDVLYAGYDYPIQPTLSADNNPWTDDKNNPEKDKGNEASPNGNDWWAEAVGAYSAWENAGDTEPIKIGVLDSGFDSDHQDLSGTISFLPDYSENAEDEHGTHVAGLIAAKNNDVGIRGVADGAELICVDWSPITNDEENNNYVNYLSTGEYIEITKQLVENDVRVINNSWGTHIKSKEGFTQALYGESNELVFMLEYFSVHKTGAYESYLEYITAHANRTALESMLILTQLFLNGEEDFLIVQSAGNGYDNGGKGLDTKLNGFYCSINENCFNQLSESVKKKLVDNGITYDKFDEHILIVGAVKNERDKNGDFKMTSFSNFGDNIDICAPGENVYSTIENDQYKSLDGTSMSGPIVAGCAGLLWSTDLEQSAEQVRNILINSTLANAAGVGDGQGKTYPVVNIGEAIKNSKSSKNTTSGEYQNISNGDIITVSGSLKTENYEINSNNKGTVYILNLEAPINAKLYDDFMGYNGTKKVISSIQLNDSSLASYVGKDITVTGTVMVGHTGHHLTDIVLIDCAILDAESENPKNSSYVEIMDY